MERNKRNSRKVLEFINKSKKEGKKLHFPLIDPGSKLRKVSQAGEIAEISERAGSDAIMVGGSDPISQKKLDGTIEQIKERTKLPIILFPSSLRYLSSLADAILYLDPLNSKEVNFRGNIQKEATLFIERYKLEAISTAYLIVKPGMRVGEKAKAELIDRNDRETPKKWGLHSKIIGYKLFYLEAGSGAGIHIPKGMIRIVKEKINIPLIVGGAINTPSVARKIVKAGADIIITGTRIEQKSKEGPQKLEEDLRKINLAIKE